MSTTKRSPARRMALCAFFAALVAICSQIQIPLPMIPINLALFGVYLAGALLGRRLGALSLVVYALLAAVGAPVLAGFTGGLGILLGKTGGYVFGYILAAYMTGLTVDFWGDGYFKLCLGMVVGCLLCYAFGTLWFMQVSGLTLAASLGYCVLPFLPGDVVKILLAALLSVKLRPILRKQNLI